MSSDGLKKIYLIKSAGYEFNEIDITDNTLLLGESGVGKTTIMRAVLFFYTMDYSDSILNLTSDTKKSFNDWYFREHNSHLVYEYTKGSSRFWFIVSKSGKLHYSFVDVTNSSLSVKTFFIVENKPITLEKLNEKIQKENLVNYHTSIKEKYINIFHQRDIYEKKIKQESVTDFSLFESVKFTKEYAKTLSNIFMSSKVNSTSIKKSIISLIENSSIKIDLYEIKINLDEYVKHKDEIDKFEQNIPQIEVLTKRYEKYHNDREAFRKRANELEAIQAQVSLKMQEVLLKIEGLEEDENRLKRVYEIEISKVDEKIADSSKEVIEQAKALKELEQKAKAYVVMGIDELVNEYNKEREYKNQLQTNETKYVALTSEYKTLKDEYKKIQEELKKGADEQILDLEKTNIEVSKKIATNKVNLLEFKDKKIEDETLKYVEIKIDLESRLKATVKEFNAINVNLGEIKHYVFNKEEIVKYEASIAGYEKELLKTQKLLNDNSFNIQKVEQNIEEIAKKLREASTKLDKESKEKKDDLFSKKSSIEQKLDFDRDNLYGYLNRYSVKNAKKIVTYLKDEILFSEKTFMVKEDTSSNVIFGLDIAFDEEFENDYEQSKLLKALKLLKDSIKQLNKDTLRKKSLLEDTATNESKEKNRERNLLYREKEKLEDNRISYEKNKTFSHLNLQNAKDDAFKLKKQKNEELQKKYGQCKIQQEELNTKIEETTKQIESIIKGIKSDVDAQIISYNTQLEESESSLRYKISVIEEKCNEEIKASQNELNSALKNSGVDEELLKSISDTLKRLRHTLEQIEKNRSKVIIYVDEYKDKITTIPSLSVRLKNDEKYLSDLKERKKKEESDYAGNRLTEKAKKETFIAKKLDIENFSNAYEEKIQGQKIEKNIKNVLSLNTYILDDSVKVNASVVDSAIRLFEDIKQEQENIESFVIKILKNLKDDNIFKITIPTDNIDDTSYLKTAKELIEYMKNDKLTLLKDASLDKFKSSIVLIKKQLSSFDEALADVNAEVNSLRNSIKKAVDSFRVIDNIDIRYEDANSNILNTLKALSAFYDNNNSKFLSGLFESIGDDKSTKKLREVLREKIIELVELLNVSKEYLELEEGFVLEFRVVERGNDLKWRQTLNDIGSNGTSTLVKSIINISMLKMVSKNISKESNLVTHCILDEIGTISTEYFRELKAFVNQSGFVFLNGMPTEDDMLMSMYPNIYVGQNFGEYSKMILATRVEL